MAKGVFKPHHKRINLIRTFKLTGLMLDQIHKTCDAHDLSFSQFVRDAIKDSLARYALHQKGPTRRTGLAN